MASRVPHVLAGLLDRGALVQLDGTALMLLASSTMLARVIVSDGDVIWTDAANGRVSMLRKDGTAIDLATNQNLPGDLTLSGSHIYWTAVNHTNAFSIWAVPRR